MPQKAKTAKAKKTKAPRKAQPLPRSVQALLKYLGGSDVRVGGARGGQPATLAPTSINIAVSQQQAQQQTQAQQSIRQRVAPKDQSIGPSPLASVIPQQPVIIQQAPTSTAETERKFQAQAKESEVTQNEINRKFGILEADQKQFRQAAALAYQNIKQDLTQRVSGDANIFDARNLASKFTPRPIVEEQQFGGMSFGKAATMSEGITVTEVFRGAREEETASGLADYLGGKYIQDVSSPEMTAIKRPGRTRKSEAEKLATKTAAAARKKGSKPTPSETTSSATLLEQRAPATIAGFTAVPEQGYLIKEPAKRMITVKRKPISTVGAGDMATQIAMLTGGGAALPPQSQGMNIAELLGAKKK